MNWRVSLYARLDDGTRSKYTFDVLYCVSRADARNTKRRHKNDRRYVPVIEHSKDGSDAWEVKR